MITPIDKRSVEVAIGAAHGARGTADAGAAEFAIEVARSQLNAKTGTKSVAGPLSAQSVVAKFTPLLMTKMFEAMMPKDKSVVGSGLAGDVWRTFLSQELANVLARDMEARQNAVGGEPVASVRERP